MLHLYSILTPVISTSILCGDYICNTSHSKLSKPVRIVLNHERSSGKQTQSPSPLCSFIEMYDCLKKMLALSSYVAI